MGGCLIGDIQVQIAFTFKHEAKSLGKRYKSLKEDITELIENLKDNPFLGKDLGGGVHKIRLAIKSKGHGKSGGARVISYTDVLFETMSGSVTLLSIYDKSEQSTISDKRIQQLLKEAGVK